jgi:porphobilinogen deaminase
MGGGCHLAVAAYAQLIGSDLVMRGVSFLDSQPRRGEAKAEADGPDKLGAQLAVSLLS